MDGLDSVTANTYLDGIEATSELFNDPYAHERLRAAIHSVSANYDFCLIDIPPSLNWLCRAAFYAADYSLAQKEWDDMVGPGKPKRRYVDRFSREALGKTFCLLRMPRPPGEWTPDGAELLFSSLRTEDAELAWRESEVYSLDVQSGVIRTLTSRAGQDFSPLPSPTGDLILPTQITTPSNGALLSVTQMWFDCCSKTDAPIQPQITPMLCASAICADSKRSYNC